MKEPKNMQDAVVIYLKANIVNKLMSFFHFDCYGEIK